MKIEAEKRDGRRNAPSRHSVRATEIPVSVTELSVALTLSRVTPPLRPVGEGVFRARDSEFLIELTKQRDLFQHYTTYRQKPTASRLRYFRPPRSAVGFAAILEVNKCEEQYCTRSRRSFNATPYAFLKNTSASTAEVSRVAMPTPQRTAGHGAKAEARPAANSRPSHSARPATAREVRRP